MPLLDAPTHEETQFGLVLASALAATPPRELGAESDLLPFANVAAMRRVVDFVSWSIVDR